MPLSTRRSQPFSEQDVERQRRLSKIPADLTEKKKDEVMEKALRGELLDDVMPPMLPRLAAFGGRFIDGQRETPAASRGRLSNA